MVPVFLVLGVGCVCICVAEVSPVAGLLGPLAGWFLAEAAHVAVLGGGSARL
jgi:hypothetical protein